MYDLGSRFYDPVLGRFISADTPDILGVQNNLYDKNLYAYCDNNPVMRKDEDGDFWISTVAIGVATQYVGDVIGNVLAGKTGVDILIPTSTIGEYVAAGITALIPGSGVGAAFVRNVVSEGITSVERHIRGESNNLVKSVGRIAVGTIADTGVEKVSDKVTEYISSKTPKNYSSYAGKQYKKNPGITQGKIRQKMGRSIRWANRVSNSVNFLANAIRSELPW